MTDTNDAISRQAAIDTLNDAINVNEGNTDWDKGFVSGLATAREYMREENSVTDKQSTQPTSARYEAKAAECAETLQNAISVNDTGRIPALQSAFDGYMRLAQWARDRENSPKLEPPYERHVTESGVTPTDQPVTAPSEQSLIDWYSKWDGAKNMSFDQSTGSHACWLGFNLTVVDGGARGHEVLGQGSTLADAILDAKMQYEAYGEK